MTPSGYIKRSQANTEALRSGVRYYSSCLTYKPRDKVKRYRRLRDTRTILRCDDCQARRLAAMAARGRAERTSTV